MWSIHFHDSRCSDANKDRSYVLSVRSFVFVLPFDISLQLQLAMRDAGWLKGLMTASFVSSAAMHQCYRCVCCLDKKKIMAIILDVKCATGGGHEGFDCGSFFWIDLYLCSVANQRSFLDTLSETLLNDFYQYDVFVSEIKERSWMNGKKCPWTPLGLR